MKQQRFRRILVGAQVGAFASRLLAGAALLIASFVRLSHQDLGFRSAESLGRFRRRCRPRLIRIPQRARVSSQQLRREATRTCPASKQVGLSDDFPLDRRRAHALRPARRQSPAGERARRRAFPRASRPAISKPGASRCSPAATSMSTTCGERPNVVLISQSARAKLFANENPIGKTLLVDERERAGAKSSAWSATSVR